MSGEIRIIHSDDDIIVIDKPAGVDSVIQKNGRAGSVAEQLLLLYPGQKEVGRSENDSGLLNRLDRETSGIMLAARNRSAFDFLLGEMKMQRIEKTYLVLVSGIISKNGIVNLPLGHAKKNKRKMATPVNGKKIRGKTQEAMTEFMRLDKSTTHSLLEVTISEGRMHQIRVHMAAIGHPVAGDVMYGGTSIPGLERHFLHAWKIGFRHPIACREFKFVSKLPVELKAVLDNFGLFSWQT
jgi:23S rRNA pseudouridine1911/1915/1917 synthase